MIHLTKKQENQYLNACISMIEELPEINDDTLYDLIVADDNFMMKAEKLANLGLPSPDTMTMYASEVLGQELWNVIDDAYDIVLTTHGF